MMRTMLDLGAAGTLLQVKGFLGAIALLYGLHWLEYAARERESAIGAWWQARVPAVVQGAAYAAFVLLLMVVDHGGQDFIYFKF
jgi:ABC-type polysaccharide/polyol phosphate export permease